MALEKVLSGLGVTKYNQKIYLLGYLPEKKRDLRVYESVDGFEFEFTNEGGFLTGQNGKKKNLSKLENLRLSSFLHHNFLTYQQKGKKDLEFAYGKSFSKFADFNTEEIVGTGMIVPGYKYHGQAVLIYGDKSLEVAFSKDFKKWKKNSAPLLKLDKRNKDQLTIKVANILRIKQGIVVVYYLYNQVEEKYTLEIALVDKQKPTEILWKNKQPIWQQPSDWEEEKVWPIGVVGLADKLISYWQIKGKGIYADSHIYPHPQFETKFEFSPPLAVLDKFKNNPLLKPVTNSFWEAQAVFNPAAVEIDEETHILYRAVGHDGRSVLGYAKSRDGMQVDVRANEPAYFPRKEFEGANRTAPPKYVPYQSGGGWGGCEDPRLTKIGDKIYLTYVAYDGCNPPRVALSSIDTDDFVNQEWNWEEPQLISKPGVVDKNACILPEKVDGKYVVFHRIYPDVLIDFVDDLEFGKGKWLEGQYKISPRKDKWDSRKLGIGPTPLKTKDGWLAIYQGVADTGPYHYKMGAMLLDKDDPTKVLHRTDNPILEPKEWYEFEGYKGGVTYPCGAVIKNEDLLIYYGAADTVTCGAKTNLNKFLGQMKTASSPRLERIRN